MVEDDCDVLLMWVHLLSCGEKKNWWHSRDWQAATLQAGAGGDGRLLKGEGRILAEVSAEVCCANSSHVLERGH